MLPTMERPFLLSIKGKIHAKKNDRVMVPPRKPGGKPLLIPPREYVKQEALIRPLATERLLKDELEIIPAPLSVIYIAQFVVYKSPTAKTHKGDKDNMVTSILDILNTVVYDDDNQVQDGYSCLRVTPNSLLEHAKIAFWRTEEDVDELEQIRYVRDKFFTKPSENKIG